MTKLLYCARPEEGQSGDIAAEDLDEVFALSQRHPTTWDAHLGQYVPNPHYVEDAFLEWNEPTLAIMLCELGLDRLDPGVEAHAWPLDDIQTRIAAFKEAARGTDPDGIDSAIHALDRLAALGARHGATHLVCL
jgi:hypothetical protein